MKSVEELLLDDRLARQISSREPPLDEIIVRLRAEIERLLAALAEVARVGTWTGTDDMIYTSKECRIAKAALNNEPQRCAECACDDPPSQCDWIRPGDSRETVTEKP